MRRRYGLLASLGLLVLCALGFGILLRGDLGWSPSNEEQVAQAIFERLPATVELAFFAFVVAVVLGAFAGFVRARARAPALRGVLAVAQLVGRAVPIIVLALFLELFAFTVVMPLDRMSSRDAFDLGDWLRQLIVPVLCLAVPFGAWMSIIFSDFFRASDDSLRASARRLVEPLAMSAALIGPALLSATIFIEPMFAWPGVARLYHTGLMRFDPGIAAGCLLTYCAGIALIGLVAGLAPRTQGDTNRPRPARSRRTVVVTATVVLAGAAFAALAADVIAPFGPYFIDQNHWQGYPLAPGVAGHVLGTEENGRDLLARALVGLRTSLGIAALAALIAAAIGFVAATATKALRRLDDPTARSVIGIRAFAGFPFVLAAVTVLVARFHGVHVLSPVVLALIIGLVSWPAIVPAFRTLTLATLGGLADLMACALLLEVTQSVIGFGVQPPTPSLGNMFVNAQSNLTIAPWIPIVPGVLVAIVLGALYALGDELRERGRPASVRKS